MIKKVNANGEIREMTLFVREERRNVFGCDQHVDYAVYRNCIEYLLEEMQDKIQAILGQDYARYTQALTIYKECLENIDLNALPKDFPLEIPVWVDAENT